MRARFLMCPPVYFDVDYTINPWMNGNIGKVNQPLAARQWNELYSIISSLADVDIIDPVPGLPDMVFTANGGMLLNNTKEIAISRFANKERQQEEEIFRRYFIDSKFTVYTPHMENEYFEGAGDGLVDSNGTFWLGYGKRSTEKLTKFIGQMTESMYVLLKLLDPNFYHLDTCFCPLTYGQYLIYPQAFETLSHVERYHDKFVIVNDEDAHAFACNAVCINDNVILPKCSDKLQYTLTRLGYNVYTVDLSEFMKAGGSAKCLTLRIG